VLNIGFVKGCFSSRGAEAGCIIEADKKGVTRVTKVVERRDNSFHLWGNVGNLFKLPFQREIRCSRNFD